MTKFNLSKLNKDFNTKEKYKERDDGSDNMQNIFHHLEPACNQMHELFLQCQACKPNNEEHFMKTGNNS